MALSRKNTNNLQVQYLNDIKMRP